MYIVASPFDDTGDWTKPENASAVIVLLDPCVTQGERLPLLSEGKMQRRY